MSNIPPCVLHIINSGGLYGAEKVLLNLTKYQRLQGWTVKVILLTKNHNDYCPLKTALNDLEIETIDVKINKLSMFTRGNQLIRLAQKHKASVLHSHGYFSDIMLAIRSRRPKDIICISTFHGWNNDISWKKKMWWYEQLNAKSAIGLDQVVAVTEAMRSDHKLPSTIKKQLCIIHNGIEFSDNDIPQDKEIIKFTRDAFIFCAVGRLVKVKGFHILLQAFANQQHLMPTAKLLIIGEGKDRIMLSNMIKELHLDNKVYLAGFKPNAADFLNYADCLVMPSLSEGLPITILETMYSNTPIIATSVGEIPQLLSNNRGSLVNPNNSDELSKAMIKEYKTPTDTEKLNNKQYVKSHFSAEKMAKQYIHLYQNIVEQK